MYIRSMPSAMNLRMRSARVVGFGQVTCCESVQASGRHTIHGISLQDVSGGGEDFHVGSSSNVAREQLPAFTALKRCHNNHINAYSAQLCTRRE
jgi:hypothetical protein